MIPDPGRRFPGRWLAYLVTAGLVLVLVGGDTARLRAAADQDLESQLVRPADQTPQALGDAIFSHTSQVGLTTWAHLTTLNHPYINFDSDALLLLTPRWNPGRGDTRPPARHFALWYNDLDAKWTILAQDLEAMSGDVTFDLFLSHNRSTTFVHRVSDVDVAHPYRSRLDHFWLNGRPQAIAVITPHKLDVHRYNDHPVGLDYNTAEGVWEVVNEDEAVLEVNNGFTVYVATSSAGRLHTVTSANRVGDSTFIDHMAANSNPEAVILASHNGQDGQRFPHALGARYDAARQQWAIFTLDGTEMTVGLMFNIVALDDQWRAYLPIGMTP